MGSPEAPIVRRDKNVRGWPMTAVRYFLYFVDAVSLRLVVKKALRSGADFIIFDRYAYDELANLTLSHPFARAYARFIMSFVPRPDISYILDADPEAAFKRKPEYPLEFLYLCRASYHALSRLLGGMTVIAPMSIEAAQREVVGCAWKQLALPGKPTLTAPSMQPSSAASLPK